MTARYATDEEVQNWNSLAIKNPDGGNIFYSYEYAQIKRLTHYTPRFIIADNLAVTVLEKKTSLGALWYLPKGPGVTNAGDLKKALGSLRTLAKKANAFTIRTEPELAASNMPTLERFGLIKAAPIIPNSSTITLSLQPSLETILTDMPQKGRHAIRRAERDGVTVERVPATEESCQKMYSLLQETAEGQFGIRSYNYYKSYWQTFEEAGLGQLFFAYFEGNVVAGAYALVFGTKSTYKDGASIRQRTAYGASHLLQWHVIQWAKEKGVTLHDFCGSPPSSEIDNPDHKHYGIGRFKLSFSRNVVDYVGCYDYVLSKTRYKAWLLIAERLHRHFYYKHTKDYYY